MNKIKISLLAIALTACSSAYALIGFDTFSLTRTFVLSPAQNFTVNGGVNLITNNPVDIVKLCGTAKCDFNSYTNTGTSGGTLAVTLQSSPDLTNWVNVLNYAVITAPTTFIYTNNIYGYNTSFTFGATNLELSPFTVTYPVAASAGFNTPYNAPNVFTNITWPLTLGSPYVQVGIRADDVNRYVRTIYTTGGTVTNFTSVALINGQTIN
jgi:hypothetical protein